jgi:CubicO group peptidase (beta-lactamase class C family)
MGLALALSACALQPQDNKPVRAYDFANVARYMDAGYQSLGLPGASLLVAKDGAIVYEAHFGTFNAATVTPIASSSKWLSAAVIMTLVDEGRIGLDDPVSQYFPQFVAEKAGMTIRQMFSHTSGIVDAQGAAQTWPYDITMAQYADRAARAEGNMAGAPGTGIRYASTSMQIVGAIAEQVTGKSWNQLFKERIGDPCDMPDTTFIRTPGTGSGRTMPELIKPTANPMLAAGAQSSLRDYAHFLEMLSNGGVYKGRRVISQESVREMQKDQAVGLPLLRASNDRMGRNSTYGLGEWVDEKSPDGRTVQVSSPGAWGFRPWINLDRRVYAVFMMQREVGGPVINATFDPWKLIDLVHNATDAGK